MRAPVLIVIAAILVAGGAVGVIAYKNYYGSGTSTSETGTTTILSSYTNTSAACDNLPSPAPGDSPGSVTDNGSNIYFTIIEADPSGPYEGMNGSAYHLGSAANPINWPVINVRQGQIVHIHVVNCAGAEAHGFAISHYLNAGVEIREGQTFDITFAANQAGTFRVYCNIFCSIHPLMQNGLLNVTAT
jgi:heme/copper-type cytochrome/quinol oxidase subunit 2